ncbi:putative DNA repair protein rhp41 [Podospora fimiseda]|uniref:DNA repair protein rhp41 n=1 Tax=Podospora fimiseda TaxID=252190 RepID=A0AAN7BV43_9PEZI|nr:putative DNA repair protein rhp41 [Podospora fimiseda]
MAGKKRSAPSTNDITPRRSTRGSTRLQPNNEAIPDVLREMLADVNNEEINHVSERPSKRKRPGEKPPPPVKEDEVEDVTAPQPTIETIMRDTDEEDGDDDDEIEFEDVDITTTTTTTQQPKNLNLNLSALMSAKGPQKGNRRKPANREEKERRVEIHKAHLICLLAHVELRNRWCNDPDVQDVLEPLLSKRLTSFFRPKSSFNQYSKIESLKRGIQEAKEMFKSKFSITERGLRRALWAENDDQLNNYKLPDDFESTHKRSDFLKAARKMEGSRDVGAQLFCALLRSVEVEARLVCSLQPLSCAPGGPTMRTPQDSKKKPTKAEFYAAAMAKHESKYPKPQPGPATPSPRSRLGHPNATAYRMPSTLTPPTPPPPVSRPLIPKKTVVDESKFPVYWVEVLDVAQQKWLPVDPLVTFTQSNTRALEPPSVDRQNNLTYVVAFNADGTAIDVTRRYAKAYNAKTRRLRVDGINASNTAKGERWWRRTLRRYSRLEPTDLDQIEDNELTGLEAREPMPRNVVDFKDHPVYALERHLRRNEVLVPDAQSTGTVSAGSKAPLERIYRRRDVRIARTREKWYRLGRVVLPDSVPVKVLPPRKNLKSRLLDDDDVEDEDDLFADNTGVPIFTESQTELYVPPPVVDGIVPRNKFKNLDVYVPSMVPAGGVHIKHSRAAQAAFILGVDYAPAVVGFEFKGRHGTAVINGVVVAEEFGEAVRAVCAGLEGMEAGEEEDRKRREVLRLWNRFLKGLRIRERVMEGVDEDAEEEEAGDWLKKGKDVEMEDVSEGEGGGGFVGLNDLSDDEGGGFVIDDGDGGGGFVVE